MSLPFLLVLTLAAAQNAPVSLPPLDTLDPPVAEQLRAAQRDVDDASRRGLTGRSLADVYGAFAQVSHAYEFFEAAEAGYREAARLAPGDFRWRHLLGYLYLQTGRLEDAAEQLAAARRLQPSDRVATVHLGAVYLQLNRLRDARAQFDDAIGIFPASAHAGLGEIALRERHFTDAIEHFDAVLARVPTATALYYSRAMAQRGLGRLDRARDDLQKQGTGSVHAADPLVDGLQTLLRGERALVMLGRRAIESGDLQTAAEAFSRALADAPDSAAARANLTELARVLVRLRRDDEAIALLTRLRTVDPADEDTLIALAILLADHQRYREAVAMLDEANRRSPDRTVTATTLARLLASAPDRALRNGPRALDLAMAVYTARATPAHAETVALALTELGRCAEAAEWMRTAVAEAERTNDVGEVGRLKGELPKYGSTCRR